MQQNRFKSWALWVSVAALVVWCIKTFWGMDISEQMNGFLNGHDIVASPDAEEFIDSNRLTKLSKSFCEDLPDAFSCYFELSAYLVIGLIINIAKTNTCVLSHAEIVSCDNLQISWKYLVELPIVSENIKRQIVWP